MNWKSGLALFATIGLFTCTAAANNLVITNVSLENVVNGTADIEFDMSWDNSWRTSWTEAGGTIGVTNWDGVWMFAKWRQSGGLWRHVMLTNSGHTATGETTIEVADDGGGQILGAFVYRPVEGSGSVTCSNMSLHWGYLSDGLASTSELDLAVFGVEMVYTPEGAFSLGPATAGRSPATSTATTM